MQLVTAATVLANTRQHKNQSGRPQPAPAQNRRSVELEAGGKLLAAKPHAPAPAAAKAPAKPASVRTITAATTKVTPAPEPAVATSNSDLDRFFQNS